MEGYEPIEAHRLDEIPPFSFRQTIIPRMDEIEYGTSSTVFLFSSTQYLVANYIVINAILLCCAHKTFRLLAFDKAHLYTMHGQSFHDSMRILQRLLFTVLFKIGEWHPLFLEMTATMTHSLISSFSELIFVNWLLKDHQRWSDSTAFCCHNIYYGLTNSVIQAGRMAEEY